MFIRYYNRNCRRSCGVGQIPNHKVSQFSTNNPWQRPFLENIYYFCSMNELSVHIITQSKDLPIVEGNDLFHSRERFLLIEQTAGTWPYMVVVTDEEGRVKAHLLAELRRRGSLLPPYLFTFARVIGAGVYAWCGQGCAL